MFKTYRKKIFRHPFILQAAAWFLAKYMHFIFKTNRWQFLHRTNIEQYWASKTPIMVCFWHNRLGMMAFSWQSEIPFHMLISGHPDGQVIAGGVSYHGIQTIAGSTNKGATDAIRRLLRVLKLGQAVGVTPDGPRGPRFSINPGLINIAKKAGVDILPMSYSTSRRIVIPSWDRLIVPLPFGKGIFICGEPIKSSTITNDAALNEACDNLQQQLTAISNYADNLCGHDGIPGPSAQELTKAA